MEDSLKNNTRPHLSVNEILKLIVAKTMSRFRQILTIIISNVSLKQLNDLINLCLFYQTTVDFFFW